MINTITCKSCNTLTTVQSTVDFVNFACPNCGSLYDLKSANQTHLKKYTYKPLDIILPIGLKGNFDNKEYEIINVLVKFLGAFTYSKEYTLVSKDEQYIYLSECNGHWIQLKQVDDIELKKSGNLKIKYNDIYFDKFDYYSPSLIRAYGFFDFELPKFDNFVVEYINPPFILSTERINSDIVTYLGQHIEKKEVKKIFKIETMPSKSGIGVVEPFPFHILDTIKIFLIAAILILTCFIFQDSQGNKEVLQNTISISEYANKEYVSPSFEVVDVAVPIKINLYSDVSNSWAYAGVSVVNEITNEEEFAEKDIEFYSGYEDGYHWTEGSQSAKFHICGLKPGKYHLVISPSAENVVANVSNTSSTNVLPPDVATTENIQYTTGDKITDSINKLYSGMYATEQSINSDQKTLTINAELESPSNWNFGISIVVFVALIIVLFVYRRIFETRRWSDSSYSPYIE